MALPTTMGMPVFEVVLLDVGSKRVAVMKILRSTLGLSLVAVRELVDAAPVLVATLDFREEAKRLLESLIEAGAAAEIR